VIVERGRVIADGPPAEVLTDDRIRETFGVEPALVRLAAGVNGGSAGADRAVRVP
jgi:ABC-type hemin transport system ATPase subunit